MGAALRSARQFPKEVRRPYNGVDRFGFVWRSHASMTVGAAGVSEGARVPSTSEVCEYQGITKRE